MALADGDQSVAFENLDMLAQIPIGEPQTRLQIREIRLTDFAQHHEEPEPGALMHDVVDGPIGGVTASVARTWTARHSPR